MLGSLKIAFVLIYIYSETSHVFAGRIQNYLPVQQEQHSNQPAIHVKNQFVQPRRLAGYINNHNPSSIVQNSETVVHPIHHSTIIKHEPYIPNRNYQQYNPVYNAPANNVHPLQHPLAKPHQHAVLAPVVKYYPTVTAKPLPPPPKVEQSRSEEEDDDEEEEDDEQDEKHQNVKNDDDDDGDESEEDDDEENEKSEAQEEDDSEKSQESNESDEDDDESEEEEEDDGEKNDEDKPKSKNYRQYNNNDDDEGDDDDDNDEQNQKYKVKKQYYYENEQPKYKKSRKDLQNDGSKSKYAEIELKPRTERPRLDKFNYQPYIYSKGPQGRPKVQPLSPPHPIQKRNPAQQWIVRRVISN